MCCNSFRILILFAFVIIAFFSNNFFPSVPVVLWYLISLNIFTFFLFVIDKIYALKEKRRVSEITLYFLSFAGGVFGAFIGMILARHKLKKNGFLTIEFFILILWIVCIYFIANNLEAIQIALKELFK
ncbi:MAG TPA: hypothetical protein CFH79_10450 [Sulfurospirillum sp. UBA11407]|jgi:uncharacterized membrane protein YsdA (DUF1294 family)|nr:MAG TPA: hypothetical protein CFH79_10450 [Sulfurospirillum sp. UBA11407]